jgi:GT2 family glycosyltransferase
MSDTRPDVTVVIPNWNGREHLERCLESLAAQSYPAQETILVDNGSQDDSLEFVTSRYPWVRVIPLPQNLGFACAVNRGIESARGEFVALLNTDTELDPGWLEASVQAMIKEPELGTVASKMLRFYERTIIDSAGDYLTRGGSPHSRGWGEMDGGRFSVSTYTFGACAAAVLYRKSMLDEIGLFDEDFVSYYEDVDLSYRAQLAGFKCRYVPAAVCYHKRGATANRLGGYSTRLQERNLTLVHGKDFPALLLIRLSPIMLASRVRRTLRLMRTGKGIDTLTGILQGLVQLPGALKKRRAVQKTRKVSLAYLKSLMGEGA